MSRWPIKLVVMTLIWVGGVGAGLWLLETYKVRPGSEGPTPARWPAGTALPSPAMKPLLLMFVHPHCPCTRGSLHELERLTASRPGVASILVLFVKPQGVSQDWEQSSLWEHARSMPGVQVAIDEGGDEARRFGALTSGQVVLYNPAGELLFSGGITAARGHEGDNRGSNAILQVLAGEPSPCRQAPVFGCPLFASGDSESEVESCQP